MTFPEILQSLRSNGYHGIAQELESRMIESRLCSNGRTEEMYAEVISESMYEYAPEPLSPEYIILSPEFAMLRSVASIMASYAPVIDLDVVIEGVEIKAEDFELEHF